MPLERALVPATKSPAASLGLKQKGQILEGYDADFAVLDKELYPLKTIVRGELVWQR